MLAFCVVNLVMLFCFGKFIVSPTKQTSVAQKIYIIIISGSYMADEKVMMIGWWLLFLVSSILAIEHFDVLEYYLPHSRFEIQAMIRLMKMVVVVLLSLLTIMLGGLCSIHGINNWSISKSRTYRSDDGGYST